MKKKTKKIVALLLAAAMVFAFTACGSDSSSGTGDYSADNPLTIKISHPDSESNIHQASFEAFKEEVESESGGAIKVEIYPDGVLGSDQDVMQMVNSNEIQMAEAGTSVFTVLGDQFGVLDLPYMFTDWDTMNEAVTGGLGDMYKGWLEEQGYYGLGFFWDGCKTVSNSKKPIKDISDLKGMKVRITDSPLYQMTLKDMGANPTAMAWGDIFSGLQQGTVDGMDVVALSVYSNGWYEAIKYWSTMNYDYNNCIVYTSKAFMDSLPADLKDIVTTAAQNMQDLDREAARAEEQKCIDAMAKEGVQVDDVNDISQFVEAVQPVYDEYNELIGEDVMKEVLKYRQQ